MWIIDIMWRPLKNLIPHQQVDQQVNRQRVKQIWVKYSQGKTHSMLWCSIFCSKGEKRIRANFKSFAVLNIHLPTCRLWHSLRNFLTSHCSSVTLGEFEFLSFLLTAVPLRKILVSWFPRRRARYWMDGTGLCGFGGPWARKGSFPHLKAHVVCDLGLLTS